MSENKRRKKNLLDDEDAEADGATDLSIRVNKEYATRFEHNKRREELHRLQAKYPEEAEKLARKIAREAAIAAGQEPPPLGDDDSSEEEEDDGEIPVDTEAKIFETLMRIRRKDPAIYQKDVKFFDDEGEEGQGGGGEEEEEGGSKKPKSAKAKPVFLKDLIAKQALEYGPGGDSSDEEEQGGGAKREGARKPKAYDAEQEDLRKAFLEAAEDAVVAEAEEGPGGVLRLRAREEASGGEESEESEEQEADPEAKRKKGGQKGGQKGEGQGQFQQLIEAYFGSEGELHPDDKFLKEYILNKGWVDRDDDYVPSYREVVGEEEEEDGGAGVDDEEDEAYLRQMDAFEAKYNFRFEEPGADRIVTHPRVVEGTIRKPDDKRKRQRDAKKQRLEEAEEAAREEVKRLKNLKKQEIESKLDKLRNVAGAAAPTAASLDDVLEGDFDPEEWDKKMAAAFDDDYYDAEEELEGLQEDLNLLGSDMEDSSEEEAEGSGDGGEEGDGEKPVRFSTLRKKLKEVDALSEEPEGEEEGKKRKADPEMAARQRAELQRLLEEYYKLDYEDNVGGIKTRFKYREVPASTFGLSVDDILRLDDKSLNQVAGMKRLAPYREDIEKQRPNYKALEMIKGEKAQLKQHRRQHWKKDRQKFRDGGRQGGQRDKAAEAGEAAGVGPGSAAADGSGDAAAGQQRSGDARKEDRKDRKATQRSRDGGENAGPGPGSQAAGAAKGGREGKKQQGGKPHGKEREQRQVDPAQARLASYAVPTLKKDSGWARDGQGLAGRKRKRDDKQQGKQSGGTAEPSDGPQMSRAQKKNLKRTMKRAEKRQAGPADA
ncbi:hypothetical protein Agub_g644 [Astrephomene gubernaculifera]|uniref:Kri1-like C-terminal domain-containing protein n=1 Tax=Astrephomene gubernaculifera TaxID=47775 RepID=A0AAD3DHI4_9CHLO|nr:hypothetical protein Agub_g644 [Astrephomene gubernaculifera]